MGDVLLMCTNFRGHLCYNQLVIDIFSMYCVRLFVVVYKLVMLLLCCYCWTVCVYYSLFTLSWPHG